MRNPGIWHNAAALSRAARRLQPSGDEIVGAECREQFLSLAYAEVFSLDIPFNRTADYSLRTFLLSTWKRRREISTQAPTHDARGGRSAAFSAAPIPKCTPLLSLQ